MNQNHFYTIRTKCGDSAPYEVREFETQDEAYEFLESLKKDNSDAYLAESYPQFQRRLDRDGFIPIDEETLDYWLGELGTIRDEIIVVTRG